MNDTTTARPDTDSAGRVAPARSLSARVIDVTHAPGGIVGMEFAALDGSPLPSWAPGTHVSLRWDNDLVRDYSLCGPLHAPTWQIAVQAERTGRGGSLRIHQEAEPGRIVTLTPLDTFRFVPTEHVVFIAGGIGATAILPMVERARELGIDWTLHYAVQSPDRMLECGALLDLPKVSVYDRSSGQRVDLARVVAEAPADAHFYVCGPTRMLSEMEGLLSLGKRLHTEHFSADVGADRATDVGFVVELASTGEQIEVAPGQSALDALENAGAFVISSCREGTCGTCETPVLEGEIDHRDHVLTPDEQAENSRMMICVSRASRTCPKIVLDV